MHDVIDPAIFRKQQQSRRLMWHERLITDPKLTAGALRFAALVFHDYNIGHRGYVSVSYRDAAKALGMSSRHVRRARDLLVRRAWLVRLPADGGSRKQACYVLGSGPRTGDVRVPSTGVVRVPTS